MYWNGQDLSKSVGPSPAPTACRGHLRFSPKRSARWIPSTSFPRQHLNRVSSKCLSMVVRLDPEVRIDSICKSASTLLRGQRSLLTNLVHPTLDICDVHRLPPARSSGRPPWSTARHRCTGLRSVMAASTRHDRLSRTGRWCLLDALQSTPRLLSCHPTRAGRTRRDDGERRCRLRLAMLRSRHDPLEEGV